MEIASTYKSYVEDLKSEIAHSRVKAALAVNKELILLYWRIGQKILEMQEKEGWGSKVIDHLSKDLRDSFPGMQGLSSRNLKYMRAFSNFCSDFEIVQQVVAQTAWGHITHSMDRTSSVEEFLWYIEKTIENGWSRNVLVQQIESNLYERQGRAITNFKETLPASQSDLAHEIIKSPYNFEFLSVGEKVTERGIEKSLLENIRDFMLEMGKGFAFVGSQYPLRLEGQEYYLDLLFYNLELRSYTAIELKRGPFKPEYAGKMNFYLNVLDRKVKTKEDNASLGIILCRDNQHITVKYALEGIQRPLGVSEYEFSQALEEKLKTLC